MQMGKGIHTLSIGGVMWNVFVLWELTKNLPIVKIPVAPLLEVHPEINWWLTGNSAGWVERRTRNHPSRDPERLRRSFKKHCKKVWSADLNYPILMTPDGLVGDGRHRVAKAHMMGRKTIEARLMTWELMEPAIINGVKAHGHMQF